MKESFEKLAKLVEHLGERCPWDRKQTPESVVKELQSEAKEVAEALEKNDAHELKEELGDVLWDVLFLANMAKKRGLFDIKNVLDNMHEKMVRRHPHVFNNQKLKIKDVEKEWKEHKQKEKAIKENREPKPIHNGTKAVLFDWDGTLINTLPIQFKIYQVVQDKMGFTFPGFNSKDQTNGDWFDCDWKRHYHEALGRKATQEELAFASKLYREHLDIFDKDLKLFDDIEPMLKELKEKGYKLAIVTNTFEDFVKQKLEKAGLAEYFEHIVGFSHGAVKPDPEGILYCMEQLGVFPEETVYVGDMVGDVLAAKNANVKKMIAVSYGFHSEDKLKQHNPCHVVHAPQEIVKVIEE